MGFLMIQIEKMENRIHYGEYTLKHWIRLILKGNIILPKYQRHFVWDIKKVETLIDTLKKKEYVPPVTIGVIKENDDKTSNLILDGQQRLTSILLTYLNIFPNKEKFKDVKSGNYANSNDDDENEEGSNTERLDWTFEEIVRLNKEEQDKIKEQTELYTPLNINIDSNFWDTSFLGFSYIVPNIKDNEKDKQQKFYSSVFRNINIQGQTLSIQESRKSLYFLKDGFENFFETKAVKDLKVKQATQPKDVDFIKYIALLSQYKKDGKTNRLAFGYSGTKKSYGTMENYYEEYIYSVVGENSSNRFEEFSKIFPDGDYQTRFDNLNTTINSLFDTKEFTSIIDLDMYLFGIIYKIVFENKIIDLTRKESLITELKKKISDFKKDNNHKKSPANLNHLKNRINSSIEIYNKYDVQQS